MAKHNLSVSVNQLAGLTSQLVSAVIAKRAACNDQGYSPDPMHDPCFRTPFVEFIQKHSIKGASTNRDGQRVALETPRDGQPRASDVITPPIGERRADEAFSTKAQANKNTQKYKTKLKERKNSHERTPYYRRDGGDAQ